MYWSYSQFIALFAVCLVFLLVTAQDGTVKTYTVTVTREFAASVFTCAVKSLIVKIGKPQQIPCTYEGNGQLTFTSANPAICGVTQDGILLPLKAGTVAVMINIPGLNTYMITVTVTA